MRYVSQKIGLALIAILSCVGNSSGSACLYATVERIRFSKGAECWYYAGKATHFVGNFSRGQRVTVEMKGEMFEGAGPGGLLFKPTWTARVPSIEGPHKFYAGKVFAGDATEEDMSRLEALLPETGQYTFSFAPCGMWHNHGHVAICVSGPAHVTTPGAN